MKKLYTINTVNNFMDIIYRPFVEPYCRNNGIEAFNIMDDSLLHDTVQNGKITPATAQRMLHYAQAAQQSGAQGILVTCTSVNEATAMIRPFLQIPILNIEEPVAEAAVQSGGKIGILATLPTSPVAIERTIRQKARELHVPVELEVKVAEGAFEKLCSGERGEHDRMVCQALYELAETVDVIAFAQISMSLLPYDSALVGKPVLKIGESGLQRIDELMSR